MFIIQNKQTDVFKGLAFKKFEDEMVEHVKEFFPNHFIAMQETNTRNTIRYAYEQGKKYDFVSQRNVCLYLNNMLVLGSNFDTDPQYPWAKKILNDENIGNPKYRADELSDRMLDVFAKIRGPRYNDINRALLNMFKNASEIFQGIMESSLGESFAVLSNLYPKKFEIVGEANLNLLINAGKKGAVNYGLASEPNILMFVVFMFMSGAGFDHDPQYPWAGEILNDEKINDENKKVKLLFDKAIDNLGYFLSKYKLN